MFLNECLFNGKWEVSFITEGELSITSVLMRLKRLGLNCFLGFGDEKLGGCCHSWVCASDTPSISGHVPLSLPFPTRASLHPGDISGCHGRSSVSRAQDALLCPWHKDAHSGHWRMILSSRVEVVRTTLTGVLFLASSRDPSVQFSPTPN